MFAANDSLLALIPTSRSVQQLVYVINNGAATLNHYSAPVESIPRTPRRC